MCQIFVALLSKSQPLGSWFRINNNYWHRRGRTIIFFGAAEDSIRIGGARSVRNAGLYCCKVTEKVEAKEGEKVIFVNKITEGVTILFPERELFGQSDLQVSETGMSELTVQPGTSGTTYRYAVYCRAKKDFCSASAMPIIIVHP